MFPVRCYTCNAVLAQLWPRVEPLEHDGRAAALDELGVRRICCRRMFFGYTDLVTNQLPYGNVDTSVDDLRVRRRDRETRVVSCD